MNKRHKFLLSIFSGVLLSLCWPSFTSTTSIVFIALMPLLFIAKACKEENKMFWVYPIISFFIWNCGTIGWIYYASSYGAFATFLLNAIFMSIPFSLFFIVYKKNVRIGFLSLIAFWMTFETIHFQWDISFPWLTLGNIFATQIKWVQWYEYTGVAGGTLWIVLANICVFFTVNAFLQQEKKWKKTGLFFLCIISIPLLFSHALFLLNKEKIQQKEKFLARSSQKNMLLVQPNYDSYTEKFVLSEASQLDTCLQLIKKQIDSNTITVVLPETALVNSLWEHDVYNQSGVKRLVDFCVQHPHINIICGATTMAEKPSWFNSPALRRYPSYKLLYYEVYNSALHINSDSNIFFYHKSQLVPGVEKMPFQSYLSFLDNFIIDLGGTTGTLGIQDTPTLFSLQKNQQTQVAPLICYESIYGAFVSEFVKKGAQALVMITNDGWWHQTDGYRQHALYTQLRAIETRRYVYRSANTGISLVLNPLGERIDALDWNKRGVIKTAIIESDEQTFYVRHPDLLYTVSAYLSIALLLLFVIFPVVRKSKFFKKNCCS